MFDADGQPQQAARLDIHAPSCWWASFPLGQDNDTVGARYRGPGKLPHWFLRPKALANELTLATEPDYVYDAAFTGGQGAGFASFTSKWAVDEFTFHSLVRLETKQTSKIESLPGAPPGQYGDAIIVGDTIFFSRFADKKVDWWVIPDAKSPSVQPFIGGVDVAVNRFAANSDWIVWNEGTDFKADGGPNYVEPQTYNLYRAPFTADGSKLQRQLLVPNTHQFFGRSVLANGYYTDLFFTDDAAMQSALYVVEVASGKTWVSSLPGSYYWGGGNYPTPSELWGTVMPDHYSVQGASEVVRVPYTTMQQIQAKLP